MANNETILTTHGISFVRTGDCNRCGSCNCGNCPHFTTQNGLKHCLIYDRRDQVCPECSEKAGKDVTHQVCIDFPNHPFLEVIKNRKCNYSFRPATEEDRLKYEALLEAWH